MKVEIPKDQHSEVAAGTANPAEGSSREAGTAVASHAEAVDSTWSREAEAVHSVAATAALPPEESSPRRNPALPSQLSANHLEVEVVQLSASEQRPWPINYWS